jgi:proteasome lid subunit RPN8/RPN11
LPLFDFSKDPRAHITGIRKRTLRMIMAASRSQYPEEFGAMLRAEEGVIGELMLLPGTVSGQSHAIFQFHNLPIDFTVVGTVHSHPSGDCYPSDADLALFRKYGWVHIISAMPFDMQSWAAFDGTGEPVELEVVD